jgi:anti-anti-sigma factor
LSAPVSPASTAFAHTIEPDRDRVIVRLRGELDLLAAPDVENAGAELVAVGFRRVTVDLREVTFMDSSGLRALMRLARSLEASGGELSLIRGSKAVDRLFELTAADALFSFDAGRAGR